MYEQTYGCHHKSTTRLALHKLELSEELLILRAYSSSWLRSLASLLVTTTSSWAARSTISFLFLVETLWAISAQYVLNWQSKKWHITILFKDLKAVLVKKEKKKSKCGVTKPPTCCASLTTQAPWHCAQGIFWNHLGGSAESSCLTHNQCWASKWIPWTFSWPLNQYPWAYASLSDMDGYE